MRRGTTSVGTGNERQATYSCICTRCGKSQSGDALCFDLTPVMREILSPFTNGSTEDKQVVDKILNEYENTHRGPALSSERRLLERTRGLVQRAGGVWHGELQVLLSEWKNPAEHWHSKDAKLSEDDLRIWAEVLERASEQHGTSNWQIPVDYYKTGDGATRINMVRACGVNMDIRYCPHCGNEMSFWSGQFPELVLTVVGGPRASKSTALAACASFFQEHGESCGIVWQGKDIDSTWKNFKKRCLNPYNRNQRVEPTQISDHEAIPRFSVRITVQGVEGMSKRDLILTVVDLPGESDANSEKDGLRLGDKIYDDYQELYRNVDCVWYCTDQAELEQLNIEASGEDMKKKRIMLGYEMGRGLIQTSERIEKLGRYAELFQKNTPVVFLLGKSDCYRGEVDDQDLYQENYDLRKCSWLELPAGSSPVFCGREYHKKALFLRKFLMERNAELVNGFEGAFTARTYIAVSSYGHPVAEDSTGQEPREPYQTELPFLWMLAVKGYLMVKDQDEEHYADKDPLTWEQLCLYGARLETYGSAARNRGRRFFGRR